MDIAKCKNKLISLNGYSWFLIVIFILLSCIMESFHRTSSFEGCLIGLPLIIWVIFFSHMIPHITPKKHDWLDIIIKNIFLLSYCFLVGGVFFVILNRSNIDIGGWWPVFLYVMYFYGIVFSLIFSCISWMLSYDHQGYNVFFCFITILLLAFIKIFPQHIKIYYFGKTDILFVIFLGLLITHFLCAALLKLLRVLDAK